MIRAIFRDAEDDEALGLLAVPGGLREAGPVRLALDGTELPLDPYEPQNVALFVGGTFDAWNRLTMIALTALVE